MPVRDNLGFADEISFFGRFLTDPTRVLPFAGQAGQARPAKAFRIGPFIVQT